MQDPNALANAIDRELYRQHIADVKYCYRLAWQATRLFSQADVMARYLQVRIGKYQPYLAAALRSADMRNKAMMSNADKFLWTLASR